MSRKRAKAKPRIVTTLSRQSLGPSIVSAPQRQSSALIGRADFAALVERVTEIIEEARSRVVRTVNSEMVLSNWHIGREIVEYVQHGEARAEYGEEVIEGLSQQLQSRVGRGYSSRNLWHFRDFFLTYRERPPSIRAEGFRTSLVQNSKPLDVAKILHKAGAEFAEGFSNRLSWSHYRALLRVKSIDWRHITETAALAGPCVAEREDVRPLTTNFVVVEVDDAEIAVGILAPYDRERHHALEDAHGNDYVFRRSRDGLEAVRINPDAALLDMRFEQRSVHDVSKLLNVLIERSFERYVINPKIELVRRRPLTIVSLEPKNDLANSLFGRRTQGRFPLHVRRGFRIQARTVYPKAGPAPALVVDAVTHSDLGDTS
ncbi:MAG TPA: DUF1016 N-terminal domain-containing protein, partial [Labilithrix sp.]|nr:DUF1016 N-terminal domain-containing protein [Labilithrix sp.]